MTLLQKAGLKPECWKNENADMKMNMKPPQPQTPRASMKRRLPSERVLAQRSRAFGDIVVSHVQKRPLFCDEVISSIEKLTEDVERA